MWFYHEPFYGDAENQVFREVGTFADDKCKLVRIGRRKAQLFENARGELHDPSALRAGKIGGHGGVIGPSLSIHRQYNVIYFFYLIFAIIFCIFSG